MNFARFDAKVEQRLATLEARLGAKIETIDSSFQAKLDAAMREQMRFFFLVWAALLVPIIGVWVR
ncbi:MAG TPA: hypothetical protein VFO55_02525 [Gemmatimonadaceae bacterium]|nr:hypothetical protein [Gemmatimonadaceae bacterium]